MKKLTLLLSTVILTAGVQAGEKNRSIELNPITTSKAAIQLFENSDKLQILGQKVNGKQTCWIEAFKGEEKFSSKKVTTTKAKFKRNPLTSCISDDAAINLIKS